MKNVIRKITTWMLVFGMTFTPVLTSIDTVMANAGEETITITVGEQAMEFTSDNLNNSAKTAVSEAEAANDCADTAEATAKAAADVAADAKAAADIAQAAATAAAEAATEAQNLQKAIQDINGEHAEQAESLVKGAETAVGEANAAADAVTNAYKQAKKAAKGANDAIGDLNADIKEANSSIKEANAAINAANAELAKKDDKYADLEEAVNAAKDYKVNVTNEKIQEVQDAIDDAEAAYGKADQAAQDAIDDIKAELDKKLNDTSKKNKDEEGNSNNLVVLTQAQKKIAKEMKIGAQEERDKAIGQKDVAVSNYTALNNLYNSDTYNPILAEQYVNGIVTAAAKAEQNAVNAEAYAAQAEAAKKQAKLNYEAAAQVLADALAELDAVEATRKGAYEAADEVIDDLNAADGAIADINGKIDYYNDLVKAAKELLGDADKGTGYQGWVKSTNEQIAAANGLVDTAQAKIDALDYEGTNDKITIAEEEEGKIAGLIDDYNKEKGEAETARGNANAKVGENGVLDAAYAAAKQEYDSKVAQAVADALKDFADTKKDYDEAVKESTAAAALSDIAAEKAQEVADILNDADNKAALEATINTADAQNALKNALARETYEGKSYQDLTDDRDAKQGLFKEADDALNGPEGLYAKYDAEFFAEQNRIKEEQQEIYNTQNGIYIAQNKIYNEKVQAISDLNKTISEHNDTIRDNNSKNNSLKNEERGAIGHKAKYDYILEHPYETYNAFPFGQWRRFSDDVIEWAEKTKKKIEDNEVENKKLSEETIPDLQRQIATATELRDAAQDARDTAKGLRDDANTAKGNAESAISTANSEISDAAKLKSDRQGALNAAQAKVDAIDTKAGNFEYNDQNTLVVDLKDEAQFKALMEALGVQYKSYHDVDGDTVVYKSVNGGWVPAWTPEWLVGKSTKNNAEAEEAIEEKYETELKKNLWGPASWDINHIDYKAAVWDSTNENTLVTITSGRAVIVCTDIDKLAVLRATYAKAQLAAAQNDAAQALTDADTAAASAESAAESEKTALGAYTSALSDLEDLQGRLELTIKEYETKEIPDLKKIKELKTLLEKINTELKYADLKVPKKVKESKKLDNAQKTEFVALEDTDMNPAQAIEKAQAQVEKAKAEWEKAKKNARKAKKAAKEAREAADYAKSLISSAKQTYDNYIALAGEPEDEGSGEGGDTTGTTPATSGPVLLPLTGGTTPSGVAGVRVAAAGEGEGTGEGTAPADNTVAKNNTSTIEETELPGAAEAPSSNLQDTDLPGAQGATDNNANLWWLWAAIALAIAIGFGIYKYADNKKKAENTIQK